VGSAGWFRKEVRGKCRIVAPGKNAGFESDRSCSGERDMNRAGHIVREKEEREREREEAERECV
jgi:hypothetical protein